MIFIRNIYIPMVVKAVIKKNNLPMTDEELIEFSQALYDAIKQKERELDVLLIKN